MPTDCELILPSEEAALKLVRGQFSILPTILYYTTLRALFITGGLFLAGERRHLIKYGFSGSIMIELWVILWAWRTERKAKPLPILGI